MKKLGKVLLIIFVGANLLIFYYNVIYLRKGAEAHKSDPDPKTKDGATTKPEERIPSRPQPFSKIVVRFDSSNTRLSQESQEELSKLFNLMSENSALKVTIIGYTDNKGNALKNLKLSVERAQSIKQFVVNLGIAHQRITVKGEGSKNPVVDNGTAEGRAQNRRVEIIPAID